MCYYKLNYCLCLSLLKPNCQLVSENKNTQQIGLSANCYQDQDGGLTIKKGRVKWNVTKLVSHMTRVAK